MPPALPCLPPSPTPMFSTSVCKISHKMVNNTAMVTIDRQQEVTVECRLVVKSREL